MCNCKLRTTWRIQTTHNLKIKKESTAIKPLTLFMISYRGFLKIQFFEADEILKSQFTYVNEDFKIDI